MSSILLNLFSYDIFVDIFIPFTKHIKSKQKMKKKNASSRNRNKDFKVETFYPTYSTKQINLKLFMFILLSLIIVAIL